MMEHDEKAKTTDATPPENSAFYAEPSFWQKLWRSLGFRYQVGTRPEGMSDLPGWVRTEISIDFGFLDRLRLLSSGKLRLFSIVACQSFDLGETKSCLDWRIVPPGSSDAD